MTKEAKRDNRIQKLNKRIVKIDKKNNLENLIKSKKRYKMGFIFGPVVADIIAIGYAIVTDNLIPTIVISAHAPAVTYYGIGLSEEKFDDMKNMKQNIMDELHTYALEENKEWEDRRREIDQKIKSKHLSEFQEKLNKARKEIANRQY